MISHRIPGYCPWNTKVDWNPGLESLIYCLSIIDSMYSIMRNPFFIWLATVSSLF